MTHQDPPSDDVIRAELEKDGVGSVTYPDVTVRLVGEDGNAFNLIGMVTRNIRAAHGLALANSFTEQAMECGSYDELLTFIQRTVNVV